MKVTLTSEQEKFIANELASGHYQSANDVITQSLGMLRAQEAFIRENVSELREKISVGVEQIRRGEVLDGQEVFDRLIEKNRQRTRK